VVRVPGGQALRGQALGHPDALTLAAFVVWAAATIALAWPFRGRRAAADADASLNWINP
jgi:hypothetical protein